jgi:DNA-binding MarR family transcriptional regulator
VGQPPTLIARAVHEGAWHLHCADGTRLPVTLVGRDFIAAGRPPSVLVSVGHAVLVESGTADRPQSSDTSLVEELRGLAAFGATVAVEGSGGSFEGVLSRVGIVLATIQMHPDSTSAELARSWSVTPQTMNPIVVELESRGLIRRSADSKNTRARRARVTDKGRRLVSKAHRAIRPLEKDMLSDFSEKDERGFIDYVRHCISQF